jgi:hypothetical protein
VLIAVTSFSLGPPTVVDILTFPKASACTRENSAARSLGVWHHPSSDLLPFDHKRFEDARGASARSSGYALGAIEARHFSVVGAVLKVNGAGC